MDTEPIESLGDFFARQKRVEFGAGEVVVRAGEIPSYMYWVEKGFVRRQAVSIEGEELTLFIFGPGRVWCVPWIYGTKEEEHDFLALTDVVLRRASLGEFAVNVMEKPRMLRELVRIGAEESEILMKRMELLVYGNARQKIAAMLEMLTTNFGVPKKKGVRIGFPMTHKLLASMVGLTRETTTIEIGSLRKDKIIRAGGKFITILDCKGLAKRI